MNKLSHGVVFLAGGIVATLILRFPFSYPEQPIHGNGASFDHLTEIQTGCLESSFEVASAIPKSKLSPPVDLISTLETGPVNTKMDNKLENEISEHSFDVSPYVTPELLVLAEKDAFIYGYESWEKSAPIGEWGIQKEYQFVTEIEWPDAVSLNDVKCKSSICMLSGTSETKQDFLDLYKMMSTDDTFVGFYGNHYAIEQNPQGGFTWVWNNFKQTTGD